MGEFSAGLLNVVWVKPSSMHFFYLKHVFELRAGRVKFVIARDSK